MYTVYNAINASNLTNEVGTTITIPPQFIGTDSDGDTIPDMVELYGLKPYSEPIGINIFMKDSDGDGLDDNVEINFTSSELTYPLTIEDSKITVSCAFDPTKGILMGDGMYSQPCIKYLT